MYCSFFSPTLFSLYNGTDMNDEDRVARKAVGFLADILQKLTRIIMKVDSDRNFGTNISVKKMK